MATPPSLYDLIAIVCLIFDGPSHIKLEKRLFICFKTFSPGLGRDINRCVKRGSNSDLTTVIFPRVVKVLLFQKCMIFCSFSSLLEKFISIFFFNQHQIIFLKL